MKIMNRPSFELCGMTWHRTVAPDLTHETPHMWRYSESGEYRAILPDRSAILHMYGPPQSCTVEIDILSANTRYTTGRGLTLEHALAHLAYIMSTPLDPIEETDQAVVRYVSRYPSIEEALMASVASMNKEVAKRRGRV